MVDIVDTDVDEDEVDLERFLDPFIYSSASALRLRPRSSSFSARTSSATPFLRTISLRVGLVFFFPSDTYFRNKSLGVSLVNFGASFGFASCWVLEGLEV